MNQKLTQQKYFQKVHQNLLDKPKFLPFFSSQKAITFSRRTLKLKFSEVCRIVASHHNKQINQKIKNKSKYLRFRSYLIFIKTLKEKIKKKPLLGKKQKLKKLRQNIQEFIRLNSDTNQNDFTFIKQYNFPQHQNNRMNKPKRKDFKLTNNLNVLKLPQLQHLLSKEKTTNFRSKDEKWIYPYPLIQFTKHIKSDYDQKIKKRKSTNKQNKTNLRYSKESKILNFNYLQNDFSIKNTIIIEQTLLKQFRKKQQKEIVQNIIDVKVKEDILIKEKDDIIDKQDTQTSLNNNICDKNISGKLIENFLTQECSSQQLTSKFDNQSLKKQENNQKEIGKKNKLDLVKENSNQIQYKKDYDEPQQQIQQSSNSINKEEKQIKILSQGKLLDNSEIKRKIINKLTSKNYQITSYIGSGGEGDIFEVINQKGKRFAIKIIFNENFEKECKIIDSIKQPFNIIQVKEYFNIYQNYNAIVMQRCIYSLNYEIFQNEKESKQFSFLDICQIVFDLLFGLTELRFYQIIHSDIKSQNILKLEVKDKCKQVDKVSQNNQQTFYKYLFTDFGCSKKQNQQGTAQTVGYTEKFCAPEQKNLNKMTHLSDVYSLGLLLNKLLTSVNVEEYKEEINKFKDIVSKYMKQEQEELRKDALSLQIMFFQVINQAKFIEFNQQLIKKLILYLVKFPFDNSKDLKYFQSVHLYYTRQYFHIQLLLAGITIDTETKFEDGIQNLTIDPFTNEIILGQSEKISKEDTIDPFKNEIILGQQEKKEDTIDPFTNEIILGQSETISKEDTINPFTNEIIQGLQEKISKEDTIDPFTNEIILGQQEKKEDTIDPITNEVILGQQKKISKEEFSSNSILKKMNLNHRTNITILKCLCLVGTSYYSIGQQAEALRYHEKIQELSSFFNGIEYQKLLIQSKINVGSCLDSLGRYQEALVLFKESLQLSQDFNDQQFTSIIYNQIAYIYKQNGLYDVAQLNYQMSLRMLNKINQEQFVSKNVILNNIGNNSKHLGKFDYPNIKESMLRHMVLTKNSESDVIKDKVINFGQKQCLKLSLIMKDHHFNENKQQKEKMKNNSDKAQKIQKDKANEENNQFKNQQKSNRYNHPDTAVNLSNLGEYYKIEGNIRKYFKNIYEGLQMINIIHPGDHPLKAFIQNNIGLFYYNIGLIQKMKLDIEQSFLMTQNLYKYDHQSLAFSLNNMGTLYLLLNQPQNAQDYFQKAIEMSKKLFSKIPHPSIIIFYSNLSNTQEQDESILTLEKALKIGTTFLPQNHLDKAFIYKNIGIYYLNCRDFQKAQINFEAALNLVKNNNQYKNHEEISIYYECYAHSFYGQNNFEKSQENYLIAYDQILKVFELNFKKFVKYFDTCQCIYHTSQTLINEKFINFLQNSGSQETQKIFRQLQNLLKEYSAYDLSFIKQLLIQWNSYSINVILKELKDHKFCDEAEESIISFINEQLSETSENNQKGQRQPIEYLNELKIQINQNKECFYIRYFILNLAKRLIQIQYQIGKCYFHNKQIKTSLEYLQSSLFLSEEFKFKDNDEIDTEKIKKRFSKHFNEPQIKIGSLDIYLKIRLEVNKIDHLRVRDSYFEKGKCYHSLKQYQQSFESFKKSFECHQQLINNEDKINFQFLVNVNFYMGDCNLKLGQFQQALNCFNQVIENSEQYQDLVTKTKFKIGECLYMSFYFDKAIEKFKEILSNNNQNIIKRSVLHNRIGNCYRELKQFEKAILQYDKIDNNQFEDKILYYQSLGTLYLKQSYLSSESQIKKELLNKSIKTFILCLAQINQQNNQDCIVLTGNIRYFLGVCYLEQQEYNKAQQQFMEANAIFQQQNYSFNKQYLLINYLGDCMNALGKIKRAKEYYQESFFIWNTQNRQENQNFIIQILINLYNCYDKNDSKLNNNLEKILIVLLRQNQQILLNNKNDAVNLSQKLEQLEFPSYSLEIKSILSKCNNILTIKTYN